MKESYVSTELTHNVIVNWNVKAISHFQDAIVYLIIYRVIIVSIIHTLKFTIILIIYLIICFPEDVTTRICGTGDDDCVLKARSKINKS